MPMRAPRCLGSPAVPMQVQNSGAPSGDQHSGSQVRRMRPEAVTATVLWTMTAWAHEGAAHSPILAAISVEPDSGKSTLLGVLRFLVPKPFVSVEPTGPSVYRTVDREHPTLIIDEADDLFYRKSDLRAIVNAG